MQYLPLFADIRDRDCLIVGGGRVAERRVLLLGRAGAKITVIAPEPSRELERLADADAIGLARRAFDTEPLDRYWLIVAATDDPELNAEVAAAARRAKRLCNVVDDAQLSTFIMPAIVDHDPVTIAISSAGKSPVLARWVKGVIETVLPVRLGELATLAGRWRERVKQALPDLERRRKFWQAMLEGEVARHMLAGRGERSETLLEQALAAWRDEEAATLEPGEAYLVGAGPGSPDLITLRGRQLLAQADVVLYDRLVSDGILEYARRDGELISVGKSPRTPSITQAQVNRLLVRLVTSGKRVCRLKGGDPMIFGRGGEEMQALAEAGLPFQVVPGVSAVEGCAAYAGIPLTLRGVSRAVVITTGHSDDGNAADLASFRSDQTLALYMGVAQLEAIGAALMDNGHDAATPAAIIQNGTMEEQRVVRTTLRRLGEVRDKLGIEAPALLLVGETTRCAERYRWFNPEAFEHLEDDDRNLAQVS